MPSKYTFLCSKSHIAPLQKWHKYHAIQISTHSPQKPLTLTDRWISVKLMRYLWPLLLVYDSLNVTVNVCASNLHEVEKSFICQPVSLFGCYVLHC